MSKTRSPAVAGSFYPAGADELGCSVAAMLAAAQPERPARPPKALIVPHAGYIYSGPVAASAYARLAPLAGRIRRVVLLGPVHRVPVRGLALPSVNAFATPLGDIPLDDAAMSAITDLPQVTVSDAVHAQEHSLEVHLPFLQSVLGDFRLLPLAVGDATPAEVAGVLERVWGGEETLIVISSDLSHFLPYAEAARTDAESVKHIIGLQPELSHAQACGATTVNGLLNYAARHGLEAELLDLRNSGDTAGDRSRVVGYAAVAFYEPGKQTSDSDEQGDTLLAVARNAIATRLGSRGVEFTLDDWLQAPAATFVTLTQQGALRGCIGSLEPVRPLLEDVTTNAIAAATRDFRFPPLQAGELDRTHIEVSLLSDCVAMDFDSEQQAVAQLRPGIDGVVLQYEQARSTFLPQVWESLPRVEDFLAALKQKAGLPGHFWHADVRLSRYTVNKWKETETARV